ncbi:hypothetical protein AB0J55_06250 [Amycolatopsis sp. NPDC049688]|uniref:hypothetical protein n=1 Tax=Amycolatopsis sp. NPDC049688 TaxID=3154733 RepID=UPI0034420F7F
MSTIDNSNGQAEEAGGERPRADSSLMTVRTLMIISFAGIAGMLAGIVAGINAGLAVGSAAGPVAGVAVGILGGLSCAMLVGISVAAGLHALVGKQ